MSAEQTTKLEQQAARLLKSRQLQAAQQLYEKICSTDKTHADAWMKLGIIHGMQNKRKLAARCLSKSLALNPGSTEARMNYGQALLQNGEFMQAIEQYEQVLDTCPESGIAWFRLGRCRAELDQLDAAIDAYHMALSIKPEYAQALHGLGFALYRLDHIEEAIGYFSQALRINPNMASAHFGMGSALTVTGKQDMAARHLREAIRLRPNYPRAQVSLAATLGVLGQPDEAQQIVEAVIDKHPDNVNAITLLATINQRRGAIDDAYGLIRPLLDAGKADTNLLLAYADISNRFDETDNAIDLLDQALLKNPAANVAARRNLHFSLGKLYDSKQQYRKAFEHFQIGNDLQHAKFDPLEHARRINAIIKTFSGSMMATMPRAGIQSERPVFVVGMPRSGTTLVEQILSGHPDVFGAGELTYINRQTKELDASAGYPQCVPALTQQALTDTAAGYLDRLSDLSPDSLRVIDKMPGNFMHLGYIELLFPGARIIHCRRDPLDTCLSNYFQNFSSALNFSFNLSNLGTFYRDYLRLMEHWRIVITLPMIEVQYEDMITNPESDSRRLIEFCGLEWNEQCMDFHKAERYVSTASYDQVRRPIYRSSVARWKNYSEFLKPLQEALGPV